VAQIGFVGLGHMGLPMAVRLIQAGFQVVGFDQQSEVMQLFVEQGGIAARHIQEVANNNLAVITMLQTGEQVHTVCCGENGLFKVMKKNAILINCSTIGMEATQLMQQEALIHDVPYLDAPVSGGVAAALGGTLTLMVGGPSDLFECAKSILSCFGSKLIHTGDVGSGQAAKLCNNMILGASMIAVSEAFLLAERLGLSLTKLHEVVQQSSGQCWVTNCYVPLPGILEHVPANHGYQPGFSAAMMLKDLRLSQSAASSVGLNTALAATATKMYSDVDTKIGTLDFSAIVMCLSEPS